ncbi:MAG TPA: hypothetical protein VFR02_05055, partial [bacterium]|nr:hypothetical protein [bacterium]
MPTRTRRPKPPRPAGFFSTDTPVLALLFLAVVAVYLSTLCPIFMDDDSAETITAGVTLGLQHPPCYPLDALLNRLAWFLPLGGPGFRAGVGSAFW